MESTTQRLDLDPAAQEPETADPITLVYERGDGTRVEYVTTTRAAWRQFNDPYRLLATFETYDDAGSCYFRKP